MYMCETTVDFKDCFDWSGSPGEICFLITEFQKISIMS